MKKIWLMTVLMILSGIIKLEASIGVPAGFWFPDKVVTYLSVPDDKYRCGGFWGFLGYKPSPVAIKTFAEYVVAAQEQRNLRQQIIQQDEIVLSNTSVAKSVLDHNQELKEHMEACANNYAQDHDPYKLERCNNETYRMLTNAVQIALNSANKAALQAWNNRTKFTSLHEGIKRFEEYSEQKTPGNVSKLRSQVRTVIENAAAFSERLIKQQLGEHYNISHTKNSESSTTA